MIKYAVYLAAALCLILLALSAGVPALAQEPEPLQFPADLFVLTDGGQVLRVEAEGGFAAAVTSADQQVADFGVAADGQWVAYRTLPGEDRGGFLAITTIDGLSGQVLEFETSGAPPLTGRGATLAWSPDGTTIAYTSEAGLRVYFAGLGEGGGPLFQDILGGPFVDLRWSPGGGYLAAERESGGWAIFTHAGSRLAESYGLPVDMTWVREHLLAVTPPDGGLLLLDVRDSTQTILAGAELIASRPTLIEGRRLIFFVHEAAGGRFAARRFGTVSLDGGEAQVTDAALELTAVMRWLPDGVGLLGAIDGALTLIEPRTGAARVLIEGVKAFAWGPPPRPEVTAVPMPADLYFLSRDAQAMPQVWRIAAGGGEAQPVTAEASGVIDFAVSPDGRQIAYTADGQLVVAGVDGSGRTGLTPVAERPGAGGQPAWHPGGVIIAYVRDGIWVIPAAGGARTELATDVLEDDTPPEAVRVYSRPRWNRDGTRLLVNVNYYEGGGLGLLPITGGPVTALGTATTQGAWLPNGNVLAWEYSSGLTTPGLYIVDVNNPQGVTAVLDTAWAVLDALPLANEAALILRSMTGGATVGPLSVMPFLVPLVAGARGIPQGQGGLLESPLFSPDGAFAAGLRQVRFGDYGPAGLLAALDLATGERYAIAAPGEVWGLQWGPLP